MSGVVLALGESICNYSPSPGVRSGLSGRFDRAELLMGPELRR